MFDFAIVAIVASNVAAAWVASTHGWSLQLLLRTYWVQSTLIGVFSFRRILALRRFGTHGVTWNDKPIEPTNETKHRFAWFFAAHFGIFHVVHFVFLAVLGAGGKLGAPLLSTDIEWILLLGFAFALSHGLSQRVNLAADLRHVLAHRSGPVDPHARRARRKHNRRRLGQQIRSRIVRLVLLAHQDPIRQMHHFALAVRRSHLHILAVDLRLPAERPNLVLKLATINRNEFRFTPAPIFQLNFLTLNRNRSL